jgi:hemoglobin-like flavoprotein
MSLTPQQITLVQESWNKVSCVPNATADLFYQRLFELDPALRVLFPSDMESQKLKLMTMLGIAVGHLHNLNALIPAVQALGRRHVGYHVTPAMYLTVGQALIDTLAVGLGHTFTQDVKEAWIAVYGTLSKVMIAAAEVPA